jgi:hypothetical protein
MIFKLVTLFLLGSGMALISGQSAVAGDDASQGITAGTSFSNRTLGQSTSAMAKVLSVQSDIQEDPDLSGEPGTPRRTQGSGTR